MVHALTESCTIVQKSAVSALQPPSQTPTGMNVNCQHGQSQLGLRMIVVLVGLPYAIL